jgi:thymidylate synthase (FAD)
MEVRLIAWTNVDYDAMEQASGNIWRRDHYSTRAEDLTEFAGRNCYQSWSKPRPETRSNKNYLRNVMTNQDFSIFEHASATFHVSGVSRSLLTQLTRHRHLSFSVLSQRYVDESREEAPIIPDEVWSHPDAANAFLMAHKASQEAYREIAETLQASGKTRKEARDAARSVLLNAQETKIVVTGNHRAWREVIAKRYHARASDEIYQFANLVLDHLRGLAPNLYQDF